jgi:hypothetical protein
MPSKTTFRIRQDQRLAVPYRVYFTAGTLSGTGSAWNLSRSGFRLDSDIPLEPGTHLTVLMMLPDHPAGIVVDDAEVCWSRGQECGLAIRHVKTRHATVLHRCIATRVRVPVRCVRAPDALVMQDDDLPSDGEMS